MGITAAQELTADELNEAKLLRRRMDALAESRDMMANEVGLRQERASELRGILSKIDDYARELRTVEKRIVQLTRYQECLTVDQDALIHESGRWGPQFWDITG